MYLAAPSTGGQILGTIGVGGLALILAAWLYLGTRSASKAPMSQNTALTVGLTAGMVWMSAGQIWGVPNDLLLKITGATQNTPMLGQTGLGAISIVLVLIAYAVTLARRTAGYLGLAMATVFSQTGGAWGMLTALLADIALSLTS